MTHDETAATRTSPARVRTALLAVQLLFGVNYLVAKGIVTTLDPAAWAVVRATSAFVILAAVAVVGRRRLPPPRDMAMLAVAGLFGVTLNQGLFLEGLARTTVSRSSLICAQIPTFVLLFSLVARQERLTARKSLGFVAGLAGVAVLLEADRFSWDGRWLTGDLLTLANAASYALFVVIGRRVMARNDPLAATAVVFFFGALGLVAYGGRAALEISPAALDAGLLVAMIYAGRHRGHLLPEHVGRETDCGHAGGPVHLPATGRGVPAGGRLPGRGSDAALRGRHAPGLRGAGPAGRRRRKTSCRARPAAAMMTGVGFIRRSGAGSDSSRM